MKLTQFFLAIRQEKVPATVSEFLDLLAGLKANLAVFDLDDLYSLSRISLIKNEKHFDRFDKIFDKFFGEFSGNDKILNSILIENQHIESLLQKVDTDQLDKDTVIAKIEKFIAQLRQEKLQAESNTDIESGKQKGKQKSQYHGSGGFSGSVSRGDGVGKKISLHSDQQRIAAKKRWKKREYKKLDDNETLHTRNVQMALRRLRRYAREGAETELDLTSTIAATANNAGYLDLKMQPERHNKVKVLLLLDIGGSMDPHVRECEALFSAAKSEFKYLKTFYFHNFIYQQIWNKPSRNATEVIGTDYILHKFNSDYKVIFVGDARMAEYEINQQYGCVEFANPEAGEAWMKKITGKFRKVVWLNPLPVSQWEMRGSIGITHNLVAGNMFPMSLQGLEKAMKYLN